MLLASRRRLRKPAAPMKTVVVTILFLGSCSSPPTEEAAPTTPQASDAGSVPDTSRSNNEAGEDAEAAPAPLPASDASCALGCTCFGQARGCFAVDPCGRVAPFDAINYCGDFMDPTTQIQVTCGPCPLPTQQCGATVIAQEGDDTYTINFANTCFLTCASKGVACGTTRAQSTTMEPTSSANVISCGPAC